MLIKEEYFCPLQYSGSCTYYISIGWRCSSLLSSVHTFSKFISPWICPWPHLGSGHTATTLKQYKFWESSGRLRKIFTIYYFLHLSEPHCIVSGLVQIHVCTIQIWSWTNCWDTVLCVLIDGECVNWARLMLAQSVRVVLSKSLYVALGGAPPDVQLKIGIRNKACLKLKYDLAQMSIDVYEWCNAIWSGLNRPGIFTKTECRFIISDMNGFSENKGNKLMQG